MTLHRWCNEREVVDGPPEPVLGMRKAHARGRTMTSGGECLGKNLNQTAVAQHHHSFGTKPPQARSLYEQNQSGDT